MLLLKYKNLKSSFILDFSPTKLNSHSCSILAREKIGLPARDGSHALVEYALPRREEVPDNGSNDIQYNLQYNII